jgi:hypothetical protein
LRDLFNTRFQKNQIFVSVLLSIFWRIWAKLLHSVQKRYTPSPTRGVQNGVTTVAPSLQCLRSQTCQVLRVVSVVKINRLILPKSQLLFLNNGIPIRFLEKLQNLKWSDYRVTYSS